ncbi:FGGY-family carbohydrate kinase [Neobacillus sp. 3P2-tot-E-2]|uniref:FGGY-family carbohydrate kinase n=1 Tax=Neobacillus sp. 3P2-tot-E-2 TaxID=3132212 RepID=UPI0039A0008A
MSSVTIGLDVGTSALKVSVYSITDDKLVENFSMKYQEDEIGIGISTVNKFVNTIITAINRVAETNNVQSVALSTQMYSFVVRRNEEDIVYQWNVPWEKDPRVEKILERFTDRSGCPTDTLFPAYKILSAKNDPNFKGEIMPFGLQEAIVKQLTGHLAGDYCNLSSYGFLDVVNRTWNEELLKLAGFSIEDMPEIKKFNHSVGMIVHPEIHVDYPIYLACGLGDGPSASYASSGTSSMAANIGTSMAVRGFVKDISKIDFNKVWTYVVDEETWVVGGISSNGSSVLDHFRKIDILKDWELDPSNADNSIMVYPWKYGERTPYWSSSLKETIVGGGMDTTKNDYSCAIIRGVAFSIASMYNEVYKVVSENKEMLVVAGGGAKSEILMEYLAGTLPVPIGILGDFDYLGSCGAAFVAAEAIGLTPSKRKNLYKIYNPTIKYAKLYGQWKENGDKLAKFYDTVDVNQQEVQLV